MGNSIGEPLAPVFIVSAGRSGSQMLARMLAVHPAICALHEPLPPLNAEAYLAWSHRKPWRFGSVTTAVKKKRRHLVDEIASANGLIYVESSHFASHLIAQLDEIFGAKFVHLVRDGRDFVRSGMARDDWYGAISLKERLASPIRRRLLVEVGNSYLDHRLRPPRGCRTRFERLAWLWAEINRSILSHLAPVPPERQMRIKVEEMDQGAIENLLGFVGAQSDGQAIAQMMRVANARPNATAQHAVPSWNTWRAEELQAFDSWAAEIMLALGYGSAE